MVDFSVFDSILDLVFIVDDGGIVVYCNDMGATFCSTSVRRVAGKVMMADLWSLGESGILPWTENSQGRLAPTPFIETSFELPKSAKTGKVQLAVRPIGDGKHWGFFFKDVSLEETLAAKYRAELAKTEEYARSLEKMVAARTAELNNVNQTLKAILNSLGQGFFTFSAGGDCGPVFTKACEEVLEGVPTDRKAWDVLAIPSKELGQFRTWIETLFKEPLPFDDLKGLGPNLYAHSGGQHVVLDYYPIRREKDVIGDVVVVATDKTAEFKAQKDLEVERQYAAMIVKYTKNKDQFLQFLTSVKTAIQSLVAMCDRAMVSSDIAEAFRILHTLEGEAGTFSVGELRQLTRESQHILEPFKGHGPLTGDDRQIYRLSLEHMKARFDAFLFENRDNFRLPEGHVSRLVETPIDSLNAFLNELKAVPGASKLTARFQDLFLRVPIENRLKYFDSLVDSVAERLNKKVKPIQIEGGDLRIFPEPYQKVFASLVHAFRNAVDHGLETPEEREWAGKDPAGEIRVFITSQPGQIHMVIRDDGKGIDPAAIRTKLPEKFPDQDFSKLSDEEVIQCVCLPGFSSRDEVGEFSGRGVGLDALREEVLKIGGALRLKSKVGQGTDIEITLPELGLENPLLRSA